MNFTTKIPISPVAEDNQLSYATPVVSMGSDPEPGDAVVRILTCGVCHTDLHYRDGGINDDFPFLLGHEAAGIVERIGDVVTDVSPGDFVVLNWKHQ